MSKGSFTVLTVAILSVIMLGNWADPVAAREGQDGSEDERDGRGDVTLEIRGEEGTGFSGACSVGGEQREISGQVPESFEFDLEGRKLSCEISGQGDGGNGLEVVLSGENVHASQRLAGGQGTSKITYDGSGSVSVMSSSSRASASGDSDSSLSKSEEKALKNLDDKIEQRVDDILEGITP